MTAILSRLVDFLSLRTLVLVLGAWLALAPPQPQPLQWLDQGLFAAGLALTPGRISYNPEESVVAVHWRDWWQADAIPWAEQNRLALEARYTSAADAYHTPWWFYPGHSALILLLMVFLLGLVPRIGLTAAVLSAGLIFLLMVVVQLGAQITRGYWLPVGLAGQYLWLGLALMGAYWLQRRWYRITQKLARQLSAERMRAGDWHGALQALRPCDNAEPLLAQLYEQGREHQRRHRLQEARACYRELQRRKPRYRDLAERLKAIQTRRPTPSNGTLAQTQVLEEFVIPQKLGRYQIEHELGRGAMGVVYLGRDPHIARQVAIKTLNAAPFEAQERDSLKARFFREAEAAGRLRHPNIVTVYDVGQEGELAFIAMDYVQGEPLSRHASGDQLLPVRKVYQLMEEVAGALAYAHGQQIIHRDIKPGNILYDPDGKRVVVTDFGIARVANSARTQTGEILGSPLYMSPEQLKGARVGQGSDIFSLGVTFYQLLTGALPFQGDSLAELSYQIVQSRHRNLREHRQDLPRSATRIVNKALQKDPAKRYANAGEMARALRSALAKDF